MFYASCLLEWVVLVYISSLDHSTNQQEWTVRAGNVYNNKKWEEATKTFFFFYIHSINLYFSPNALFFMIEFKRWIVFCVNFLLMIYGLEKCRIGNVFLVICTDSFLFNCVCHLAPLNVTSVIFLYTWINYPEISMLTKALWNDDFIDKLHNETSSWFIVFRMKNCHFLYIISGQYRHFQPYRASIWIAQPQKYQ